MKNTWQVMALRMGEMDSEQSMMTFRRQFGETIVIPIWAAAIWNDEHKILVDTGIDECEWITRDITPCRRAEGEDIVSSIKKHLGWEPEDVDIVINTHLHHDHCGGNCYFKNARFYVQESEYRDALNPAEHNAISYKKSLFDESAVDYFDWIFVNGEKEIFPGLKVIPTPGHSAGHQSVLVKVKDGKLGILGDVSNLSVNMNENIPGTFVLSYMDAIESMARMRTLADYMIPGHEPGISDGQTGHFPKIIKQ